MISSSKELLDILSKFETLGNKSDFTNFLFFPIRPDFRDSRSLLGFYNPLKESYHSTPLLDFILMAARNYLERGKDADPFFVLLDEMNLARVEYYFADFLSVLEAKRFTGKNEALSNPSFAEFIKTLGFETLREDAYFFTSHGIKLHSENHDNIPKELFLPPNLYFVGTINVDETTHPIAPKVLDRAFTLEFEVGSFENYLEFLKEFLEKAETFSEEKCFTTLNESQMVNLDLKKDFTRNGCFATIDKKQIADYCSENEDVVKLLEEINKILKRYGFHFGYRVFDEIIAFLANAENSKLKIEKTEALDFALKSKVLPKFSGNRQRLEKPILELLELLQRGEGLTLVEELKKLNALPWFEDGKLKVLVEGKKDPLKVKTFYPYTVAKLLEMLYKLKTEGFASFV